MSNFTYEDFTKVRTTFVPGFDPGPIGAGKVWADATTGIVRVRNAANTGWENLGGAVQAQAGSIAASMGGAALLAGVSIYHPQPGDFLVPGSLSLSVPAGDEWNGTGAFYHYGTHDDVAGLDSVLSGNEDLTNGGMGGQSNQPINPGSGNVPGFWQFIFSGSEPTSPIILDGSRDLWLSIDNGSGGETDATLGKLFFAFLIMQGGGYV